jgi:hypothetical protein
MIAEEEVQWTVAPAPAGSGLATSAVRAAINGLKHYLKSVTFTISVVTALAAGQNLECQVLDGATIIWRGYIGCPNGAAVGTVFTLQATGLNIQGTNNTAMTAQFSAAAVTCLQSISLGGTSETQ